MIKNITAWFNKETFSFRVAIIVTIVALSRIPFLSAGYGIDVDAWRVAAVARNISETGQYGYSRVPGHPVQEIVDSFFWSGGPVWLNGLTALMSVIAVIYFIQILRKLKFKYVYLTALAFAFTPVIYINSVNSLDHLWYLAFLLASMYYVMSSKPVLAGIMLGLANGCRLTSALMVIPLAMLLYNNYNSKKNFSDVFKFIIVSGIVTLILFTPGFLTYGFDLFKDFSVEHPGFIYVVFRMMIGLWGLIGIAAILITGIIQVIDKIKNIKESKPKWDKYFDYSLITGLILFVIIFTLLPYKANYLIPAVPLFLILLGRFLKPVLFKIVCVSLILSSFLFGVNRTFLNIVPHFSGYSFRFFLGGSEIVVDPITGPMLSEYSKRLKQLEYADKIIAQGKLLSKKSVIVTADSYPLVDVKLPHNVQGNVVYESLLDSSQLKFYVGEGYDLFYLPGKDYINMDVYNVDLNNYGAKDLFRQ